MKKNLKLLVRQILSKSKALVIMLLFFHTVLSYGQQQKINLSLKSATVSTVIKEIEKQSGLTFFYHIEDIDLNQKITVNVQNKSLTETLKAVSSQTNLSWKIENNQILLYKNTQVTKPRVTDLKGTVKDETGNNLPGVTISVKGKSKT